MAGKEPVFLSFITCNYPLQVFCHLFYSFIFIFYASNAPWPEIICVKTEADLVMYDLYSKSGVYKDRVWSGYLLFAVELFCPNGRIKLPYYTIWFLPSGQMICGDYQTYYFGVSWPSVKFAAESKSEYSLGGSKAEDFGPYFLRCAWEKKPKNITARPRKCQTQATVDWMMSEPKRGQYCQNGRNKSPYSTQISRGVIFSHETHILWMEHSYINQYYSTVIVLKLSAARSVWS